MCGGAKPRRLTELERGLRPWFELCSVYGPKAVPRAKPKLINLLAGEAEPRRTSGGRAAAKTFEAKLVYSVNSTPVTPLFLLHSLDS
jgi:hypothetical protein